MSNHPFIPIPRKVTLDDSQYKPKKVLKWKNVCRLEFINGRADADIDMVSIVDGLDSLSSEWHIS